MDSHLILSLFHLLAVVPFFLYIGFERAATPEPVFTAALVIGIVITLYHSFKAYKRWLTSSPYLWVNMIHVFYVGPLLVYIGWQGKNTPRYVYELLLMVAFAAGGYHLYSLIQSMNNVKEDH